MKILIADDGDEKVTKLLQLLERKGHDSQNTILANCVNSAKTSLREHQFALAIIDLRMSNYPGGDLLNKSGLELIKWYNEERSNCKTPWKTIIFTSCSETQACEIELKQLGLSIPVIKYDPSSTESLATIVNEFEKLQELEKIGALKLTSQLVDIAIICALQKPEFSSLLKVFNAVDHTEIFPGTVSVAKVSLTNSDNITKNIILACSGSMGSVASSLLAAQVINYFNPKLIILAGITGGIKNKVKIGDVICATAIINYGSGKIKGGIHIADVIPEPTSVDYYSEINNIARMKDLVKQAHSKHTSAISEDLNPTFHNCQLGSSDLVIADEGFIDNLKTKYRQMCGIEMESYGISYVVSKMQSGRKFLVIKSVCDLAGDEKDDKYQEYCSLLSGSTILSLIQHSIV